jgi:hypothetical protein
MGTIARACKGVKPSSANVVVSLWVSVETLIVYLSRINMLLQICRGQGSPNFCPN